MLARKAAKIAFSSRSSAFFVREMKFQKEQQNHLQLGIFETSKVHETHAQTSFQAPKDLPTHP